MAAPGDPLTYRIIEAAMYVHRSLGPGLHEKSYGDALEIVFARCGIPFRREAPTPVLFEGARLGFTRRCDFLCFGKIAVELKATEHILPVHVAQTLHYLSASDLRTGLILNFGRGRLHIKRLVNDPTWSPPTTAAREGLAPQIASESPTVL